MSRNARHATVTSQPVGSAGGSSPHVESARMSASWTASSAVAKSAPRRTRTLKTAGTSPRSSTSSTSLGDVGRRSHERPDLEPLEDRLAVGARRRRELTGELDGALVAVDVDRHPAGNQVLGLGKGAVDHCRSALAVVAHPRALRRQRLSVDQLATRFESGAEVLHELDVRLELLGLPLV